jgi:hypothetical protein
VIFHSLGSIDIQYQDLLENTFSLSALADLPIAASYEAEQSYQELEPAYFLSPGFTSRPFKSSSYRPEVSLRYLHGMNGGSRIAGSLSSDKNIYGSRVPWRRASQVGLTAELFNRSNWKVVSGIKWTEEFEEKGTLLSMDLNLLRSRTWKMSLNIDLLGTRSNNVTSNGFNQNYLISKYQNLDRASIGFQYIF